MSNHGNDRRRFGRRDTNWQGRIVLDGRRPVLCWVKDCSVGGALLELLEPARLPFSFLLEVDVSGFRCVCEIRHQNGTRVGVEFVRPVAEVAAAPRQSVREGGDWTAPTATRQAPQKVADLRALVRR